MLMLKKLNLTVARESCLAIILLMTLLIPDFYAKWEIVSNHYSGIRFGAIAKIALE